MHDTLTNSFALQYLKSLKSCKQVRAYQIANH